MVIFRCYVSLPEGRFLCNHRIRLAVLFSAKCLVKKKMDLPGELRNFCLKIKNGMFRHFDCDCINESKGYH